MLGAGGRPPALAAEGGLPETLAQRPSTHAEKAFPKKGLRSRHHQKALGPGPLR